MPALTRAGIAHLYFVSIHPFKNGNDRIARALSDEALSQCLGQPTLIALSHTICRQRKTYYKALEDNNKGLEITDWLVYFARALLEAQRYTQRFIDFLIEKTKLYDRLRSTLNARQEKVLARMFREGLEGRAQCGKLSGNHKQMRLQPRIEHPDFLVPLRWISPAVRRETIGQVCVKL